MNLLPIELWEHISSYSECRDASRLRKTCKSLYNNLPIHLHKAHSGSCKLEKMLQRRLESFVEWEEDSNGFQNYTFIEYLSPQVRLVHKWKRFQVTDFNHIYLDDKITFEKKINEWWSEYYFTDAEFVDDAASDNGSTDDDISDWDSDVTDE